MKRFFTFLLTVALFAFGSVTNAAPIKILIIDGQNNHNWKAMSPFMKAQLEKTGRFTVDISTTPSTTPNAPKSLTAAQALAGIGGEARIDAEKRLHQLLALSPKLPQPLLDRFERRDRQQMDSDLEGETQVVQVAADLPVKTADGLQFGGVQQMLRYAQEILVGVGLDL